MDWLQIARTLAPIAPTVLGFVGGFIPIPGASIAMSILGKAIAGALGVPATPEAVDKAIANANDLEKTRIMAVLEETKAKWAAGTEQERIWAHVAEVGVAEVNETMRDEQVTLRAGKESLFYSGWRPAAGWIFDAFMAPCGVIFLAMMGKTLLTSPTPLTDITAAWPILLSYIAALAAMVGVIVNGRTEEKKASIATGVPMPNATPPVVTTSPKPVTTLKSVPLRSSAPSDHHSSGM